MIKVDQPVALIFIFTWVGFVSAISFLEAWLKFRAPGITVPLGLGIGRLVFNALNKIEWVFALIVIVSGCWHKALGLTGQTTILLLVVIVLLLQTCWLLTRLDARAAACISGKTLPRSYLHLYFIGGEVIKTASLIIYGINLFK